MFWAKRSTCARGAVGLYSARAPVRSQMPATSRSQLLHAARALCDDFAAKKDVDTLIAHFSNTHQCIAIEYGEQCLAPFIGRPFVGLDAIRFYFEQLAGFLTYENMRFSDWIIDSE
jgi:hypothetical protein